MQSQVMRVEGQHPAQASTIGGARRGRTRRPSTGRGAAACAARRGHRAGGRAGRAALRGPAPGVAGHGLRDEPLGGRAGAARGPGGRQLAQARRAALAPARSALLHVPAEAAGPR